MIRVIDAVMRHYSRPQEFKLLKALTNRFTLADVKKHGEKESIQGRNTRAFKRYLLLHPSRERTGRWRHGVVAARKTQVCGAAPQVCKGIPVDSILLIVELDGGACNCRLFVKTPLTRT